MPKGSLEISTFEPLTAESSPVPEPSPERSLRDDLRERLAGIEHRIPGAAVGVLISVLLHAFLLTSVLWGVTAHSRHRQGSGSIGSARAQSHDAESMQWVTLNLGPSPHIADKTAIHLTTPKLARVAPPKITANTLAELAAELDSGSNLPSSSGTSSSATTDSAAVGTELIALAGRYVGQIDARIGRAWLRSRTAIGAPQFACRVRIDQDRSGEVLHVALERCNGTIRWQRSLVEAIESASPLPQPPKPSVFAPTVHMSFQALAYQPGMPTGQYEPLRVARATLIVPAAQAVETALSRFHKALENAHPNKVIRLTIVGASAENALQGPPPQP